MKDPLLVNSLCLKKGERIEALGLVWLLALLLWRLMERQMRAYVETTGTPWIGWDKKLTTRPTALMMLSKFTGVMVLQAGEERRLGRPLSAVHTPYLTALEVSATCFPTPKSTEEACYGSGAHLTAPETDVALVGGGRAAEQRDHHE